VDSDGASDSVVDSTQEGNDNVLSSMGCSSSMGLSAVAFLTVCGAAVLAKRKED